MPFKKGQSGNPAGKPKGTKNNTARDRFRTALRLALGDRGDGDMQKALREIAGVLIEKALAGEGWAIKEIADRLDGKPAQAVTVASDEERPFRVQFIEGDDKL